MICDQVKAKHFTFQCCNVCYAKKKIDNFFILVQCGHEFCTECWRSNLESLVKECNIGKLKCLEYECKELLTDE